MSRTGWSTDYYQIPEGATELQDLIEHREMNFAVGNIFKAAYRLGMKQGTDAVYDLNKIIWFAQREKDRIERGNETNDYQANVRAEHSGRGASAACQSVLYNADCNCGTCSHIRRVVVIARTGERFYTLPGFGHVDP
jgi:hypothetical protein